MRSKIAVLAGLLCLLATVASADITRVSPSSFPLGGEDFLSIYGSTLAGNMETLVVFDGSTTVEASEASSGLVVTWVPVSVLLTPGTHSIEVHSVDDSGTRIHGPAFFDVVAPVPDGPPLLFLPEAGVVAEAEGPGGATVTFSVTAVGALGDDVPVTCSPISGSHFSLNTTNVNCSATDAGGTTNGSFVVLVTDTTSPVLTLPDNIVSQSPVVAFTVSAVDGIDGPVTVSCSAASGSTFPGGNTVVRCSAQDSHANRASGSFSILITSGPPVLDLPADFSVVASGPAGAVVTYDATAADGTAVACTPASGSTFGMGNTVVSCSATNAGGTTAGSFTVTVFDPVGPVLTLPPGITVETPSLTGVVVTFVSSAIDAVDGARPVSCGPASGSHFPLGLTTVYCSSFDSLGNEGTGSFVVTVNLGAGDTTPPELTLPGTITKEATGPAGAIATYTASAHDLVDGPRPVTCAPLSGSVFALGTTTVTCTASDTSGNTANGSFSVVVEDTTAPALTLPSQITEEATSPSGATVVYVTSASDIVDGSVPVDCVPLSGSIFALGTTTVTCTASDASGNDASGSFDVVVEDTTPPEITGLTASPNTLWPPNHQMVTVTVTVTAADTADPSPVSQILSVTSNQPVNGTGDGDTGPDWIITGPLTLQLRAERSSGKERLYTITVQTSDSSGNVTVGTVIVRVPGSKSRAIR